MVQIWLFQWEPLTCWLHTPEVTWRHFPYRVVNRRQKQQTVPQQMLLNPKPKLHLVFGKINEFSLYYVFQCARMCACACTSVWTITTFIRVVPIFDGLTNLVVFLQHVTNEKVRCMKYIGRCLYLPIKGLFLSSLTTWLF